MDLNKAMVIGRLTQDPELKTTSSGQSVCRFTIATNSYWTDQTGQRQERVEYHNIVTWRRLAEICAQYLSKGRRAYIEGRLQTSSWQDQNGTTKYRTEIIADNMIMLDPPSGNSINKPNNLPNNNSTSPNNLNNVDAVMNAFAQQDNSSKNKNDDQEIKIEDIPF